MNKKQELLLVALVLILAVGIRVWGLDYGLPHLYDPDEPVFVEHALQILQTGDWNPHWFGHPGTTTIYMNAFLYRVIGGVGTALGYYENWGEFCYTYYVDPTAFYYSGRLLIALFGVLSVLLTYLIGRRALNKRAGLIAALLLAISPLHVYFSRLIRTDVEMGFFSLLCIWFCLGVVKEGRWRDYILAGVFAGVAFCTKYPAAMAVLVIALAHFYRTKRDGLVDEAKEHLKLVGAAGSWFVGAFAASPYFFLDFGTAFEYVKAEARPTHLSATGGGLWSNLSWYLQEPLTKALTTAGVVLAIGGLIYLFIRKREGKDRGTGAVLALYPVVFTLFISSLSLRWDRWVVPAVAFLCLAIAAFVDALAESLQARAPKWGFALAALVVLGLAIPMGINSAVEAREFAGDDTRTSAMNWMLENVPAGTRILSEVYTPEFSSTQYEYYGPTGDGTIYYKSAASIGLDYYIPQGHLGTVSDTQAILDQDIEYVLFSNIYDRYLAEGTTYADRVANYEALFAMGDIVFETEAIEGKSRGPIIRILEIRQ